MRLLHRCCGLLPIAAMCLPPMGKAVAADVKMWPDAKDDSKVRRTDLGADGPVLGGIEFNPHDILQMSICGWSFAGSDPYTGTVIPSKGAHLFRFDLVMDGLVTPPGTLGEGTVPFNPFQYGDRPIFGFIEFDLDGGEQRTGGECTAQARSRYAANVGRFGHIPYERAEPCVQFPWDADDDINTEPKFELSGADYSIVFCGCWPVAIKAQNGNGNGIFDPGETWVVTGRFFQRAGGFVEASNAFGTPPGTGFGLYDPLVDLRFAHNLTTNQTTITLVYALDMVGAAVVAGNQPAQAANSKWSDHHSVYEALNEFINSGNPRTGCSSTLVGMWDLFQGKPFKDYENVLDVSKWEASALIGTSYSSPQEPGTNYVWMDTAGKEVAGDLDGDGFETPSDPALIYVSIGSFDGVNSPTNPLLKDCDGEFNGIVTICDFGKRFSLYDVDYNGVIAPDDAEGECYADCDGDNRIDISDVICFQTLFAIGSLQADCDKDLVLGIDDFVCFQTYFAIGC